MEGCSQENECKTEKMHLNFVHIRHITCVLQRGLKLDTKVLIIIIVAMAIEASGKVQWYQTEPSNNA
jgi:uncharacterized membrane protein YidH (DUF202 family)